MRYYPPRLKELAYQQTVGRRSEQRAKDVYFALGEALQNRDLSKPERASYIVTRRSIEDRHPGMRLEEYRQTRANEEWQVSDEDTPGSWKPVPLKAVTVHFDEQGGTIEIPVARSNAIRIVTFADREHLLNILAGMALAGFIDPESTIIRRSSSAIPYLQFVGSPR